MKVEWHELSGPDIAAWMAGEGPALKEVVLAGRKLCLVRLPDGISAIDPKCPHAGAPLVHGQLDEQNRLICPWHRFAFDPVTGNCSSGGYFVNTYPTERRQHQLRIGLPARPWWKIG